MIQYLLSSVSWEPLRINSIAYWRKLVVSSCMSFIPLGLSMSSSSRNSRNCAMGAEVHRRPKRGCSELYAFAQHVFAQHVFAQHGSCRWVHWCAPCKWPTSSSRRSVTWRSMNSIQFTSFQRKPNSGSMGSSIGLTCLLIQKILPGPSRSLPDENFCK